MARDRGLHGEHWASKASEGCGDSVGHATRRYLQFDPTRQIFVQVHMGSMWKRLVTQRDMAKSPEASARFQKRGGR